MTDWIGDDMGSPINSPINSPIGGPIGGPINSPPAFILLHAPDGRPLVLPTNLLMASPSGHHDGLPPEFRVGPRRYTRTGDGWTVRNQVEAPVSQDMDVDQVRLLRLQAKSESAATVKVTAQELEQAIASWEQAGGVRSPAGSRINWLGQTASCMVLETPDVVYARLMPTARA